MTHWKPSASIQTLKFRHKLMTQIRQFFAEDGIMEVDTPLLTRHTVTDRYMKSFCIDNFLGTKGYLQTSPEFAMKRLLAAGSGSIFQICKSFRQDELGVKHNPEFTMLEWYLVNADHHQLMEHVYRLLKSLCLRQQLKLELDKRTYQSLFLEFLEVDPMTVSDDALQQIAKENLGDLPLELERDDYLSLLFEDKIEQQLGQNNQVTFVYDYPASQAALARIDENNPLVASRFEVYWKGVELANGFYELTDSEEQERRFKADNLWRAKNNLPEIEIDHYFLEALNAGLPQCSGVALGVDRLTMILLGKESLQEVIAFPADHT